MEIGNQQFDITLPYSISSYLNDQLLKANNLYHLLLSEKAFANSKNFIIVLSAQGHLKKSSISFINMLGYSDEELLSMPFKNLVVDGNVFMQNKTGNYYFENTICCNNNTVKRIKWRLIPDVMEDCVVFVGWEIK